MVYYLSTNIFDNICIIAFNDFFVSESTTAICDLELLNWPDFGLSVQVYVRGDIWIKVPQLGPKTNNVGFRFLKN